MSSPKKSLSEARRSFKVYFPLSSAIFLAAAFIGYLNGSQLGFLIAILKEFFQPGLFELPSIYLMVLIFGNNAVKSFILIPLGALIAIPPVIFLSFNGLVLGLIAYDLISNAGQTGFAYFMLGILPHGVIELTAVFLSASLSLRIAAATLRKLKSAGSLKEELFWAMKFYAIIILPLLLVASFIEAFITPLILREVFPELIRL